MLKWSVAKPALVVGAMLVAGMTGVMPVAADDFASYCQHNPNDPRCNPDYCIVNPNDPWCRLSHDEYCVRFPEDPKCNKQEPVKKDHCEWIIEGVGPNPVTGGFRPGPQRVTLLCPDHIVSHWDCGVKNSQGVLDDPICQELDRQRNCPVAPSSSASWLVMVPNVRGTITFLRVWTWKDADCDGLPDDWNASTDADGDGKADSCFWVNYYVTGGGPGEIKQPPEPSGRNWPYLVPPFGPTPDGKIDECDYQIYEFQWPQFN